MINKEVIEKILSINGVAPTAADEEIKEVLLSAKWNNEDVDTALYVLRENKSSHEQHVDTIEHVFRTDSPLHPDTISALLGVEVEVPLSPEARRPYRASSYLDVILIVALATVLAGCTIGFIIWYTGADIL